MGNLWLASTTGASASASAKSGLTAASSVMFGDMLYLTVNPTSALAGGFEKRVRLRRVPVSFSVKVGMISSVRSASISSRPVILPNLLRKPGTPRGRATHELNSPLRREIVREALNPQNFPFPAE